MFIQPENIKSELYKYILHMWYIYFFIEKKTKSTHLKINKNIVINTLQLNNVCIKNHIF